MASSPRAPAPLPEAIAIEIAHARSNAPEVMQWQQESKTPYQLLNLAVPLADEPKSKIIDLEYYRPRKSAKEPTPVIIILPVSAGEDYPLERHFARYFARHHLAALIVHREKGLDPKTANQINGLLKQSVFDNAMVIDWIETRPELDRTRIGLLGTSMGAIKGALFVPTDSRVKAAALGLVGEDLPYILAYSTEGAWRGGGIVRLRKAYLKEHHLSRDQFRKELEATITYDPKYLAPSVDPRKVLLILASCDTIVPFKKGQELRRDMGKPETAIVLSGHYTALFYLWYIRATALKFFRGHL